MSSDASLKKVNWMMGALALSFLVFIGLLIFTRNVEKRHQQMQADLTAILRATERSVVMVTVANKNGHGVIRQITGAAETLFGWNENELFGKPVETLMAPEHREKHKAGLAKLITWIESEIAAGRDVDVPVQAISCDGWTRDEQRVPVLVVTSFAGVADTGEILMVAAIYDARNAKIVLTQKEPDGT